jgi:hypothetical protein
LFKLQELVKAPAAARTEMYIRQAGPTSYRQVLREVRQKEIYKLIVDTNPRNIQKFFRAVSAPTLFISHDFPQNLFCVVDVIRASMASFHLAEAAINSEMLTVRSLTYLET